MAGTSSFMQNMTTSSPVKATNQSRDVYLAPGKFPILPVAQDAAGMVIATKTALGEVTTTTVWDEKKLMEAAKMSEGTETNHDLSSPPDGGKA